MTGIQQGGEGSESVMYDDDKEDNDDEVRTEQQQ